MLTAAATIPSPSGIVHSARVTTGVAVKQQRQECTGVIIRPTFFPLYFIALLHDTRLRGTMIRDQHEYFHVHLSLVVVTLRLPRETLSAFHSPHYNVIVADIATVVNIFQAAREF